MPVPTLPRVAFPLVLQSPVTGSAIVGAKATITKHVAGAALGSGEAAEIFLSETEATKVAGNVITSDNTGRWTQGEGTAYAQYWLPAGTYDISISGTGITTVVITRELTSGNMLASRVLSLVEHGASFTAASGELVKLTKQIAVTLPTPTLNATIGILTNGFSVSTVTAGSGLIYGGGLEGGSSLTLYGYRNLTFWADGTNWYVVSETRELISWGTILGAGTISSSSGDFTVAKLEAGKYEVKWTVPRLGSYAVTVTPRHVEPIIASTGLGENAKFVVTFWNTAAVKTTPEAFNFMVIGRQ